MPTWKGQFWSVFTCELLSKPWRSLSMTQMSLHWWLARIWNYCEWAGTALYSLGITLTDGPTQPGLNLGNWILTRSYRLGLTSISVGLTQIDVNLLWITRVQYNCRTSLHWWELPWNHLDLVRIHDSCGLKNFVSLNTHWLTWTYSDWQRWPPSDQYTCFRNKEYCGSLKLPWTDLNNLSDMGLRSTGNGLTRQEVLKLTYTHSH